MVVDVVEQENAVEKRKTDDGSTVRLTGSVGYFRKNPG